VVVNENRSYLLASPLTSGVICDTIPSERKKEGKGGNMNRRLIFDVSKEEVTGGNAT
jgi:hypothetical protein